VPVDPAASRMGPSTVTVGVRPRALSPASPSADTIAAVAELIEPMGAETLIHARGAAGQDIRVVLPRDRRMKVGETIHLACDPRQTHIFDSNGKAVRS